MVAARHRNTANSIMPRSLRGQNCVSLRTQGGVRRGRISVSFGAAQCHDGSVGVCEGIPYDRLVSEQQGPRGHPVPLQFRPFAQSTIAERQPHPVRPIPEDMNFGLNACLAKCFEMEQGVFWGNRVVFAGCKKNVGAVCADTCFSLDRCPRREGSGRLPSNEATEPPYANGA
jgi:hypothetical protein